MVFYARSFKWLGVIIFTGVLMLHSAPNKVSKAGIMSGGSLTIMKEKEESAEEAEEKRHEEEVGGC